MKRGMGKNFNMFWKKAHNQEFKCKRSVHYGKALDLVVKYYDDKLLVEWGV
jgi:hypothetical protein